MDAYFIFELLIPIMSTAVLAYFLIRLSKMKGKSGFKWNAAIASMLFVLISAAWFGASHLSNTWQCHAAYGPLAESQMCDNPQTGLEAMVQFPIIYGSWMVLSIFSFFSINSAQRRN